MLFCHYIGVCWLWPGSWEIYSYSLNTENMSSVMENIRNDWKRVVLRGDSWWDKEPYFFHFVILSITQNDATCVGLVCCWWSCISHDGDLSHFIEMLFIYALAPQSEELNLSAGGYKIEDFYLFTCRLTFMYRSFKLMEVMALFSHLWNILVITFSLSLLYHQKLLRLEGHVHLLATATDSS